MKKFKFQMEKLLSYKDQVLDSELMNMAVLNNLMDEAVDKHDSLEEEKQKNEEEFQEKIKGSANPALFRIYRTYNKHIDENIEVCEEEIDRLNVEIEEQVEVIKGLKIETKSLETLKENKYEEYVKEGIKKNEIAMDEFAARKLIVNKKPLR